MPSFDVLLWIVSALLMAAGLAGAVLPVLPGAALVLAGAVLGAWIDGFERVGGWTLGVLVALAILSWVLDYVAALLGAKKVGASRLALLGAAIGTVAGLMFGIVGVFVLPFIGAALGEYIARRDHQAAARVGMATGLGLLLALVAKVVIAFMMIGLFVAALIF
ncbi:MULTISPECIES: DUF456 domain-containing protein [unclassified Roseateles]|uniref:DUF456 domain-containing protein n=1 Tax=unclassified Roseateles TaxID=2626991 RepID=UPI0006F75D58|nr:MULTISPECIES: DUF456 domain-containing protein [unclassified Roseateles]KQW42254.1 hypothetical protein ASC81_20540 [Pelomonas sp. Root405]KRA68127.1 hypothetical protein ASD88_22120 [Pelomonas sp. Root662]